MTSWPLAALLDAQTITVIGVPARISQPLRRKGRGKVDFALIAAGEDLVGSLVANAHLHIGRHREKNRIATDGAIWRPGLELNIRYGAAAQRTSQQHPSLLFADTAGLLHALLGRGHAQDLDFSAAISPGADSTARDWHHLLDAALCLPSPPLLCFAVGRPSTVEVLLQRLPGALTTPPLVLLLPTRDAAQPHLGHQARLCAAGIPSFSQPARLFAAHRLQQGGLEPATGYVLPLVAEPHEAPLLESALEEARLRPASPRDISLEAQSRVFIAPSRQYKLGRALRRVKQASFDVIVSCGRVPQAEGVEAPHLSLDDAATTESSLHALRSLLDAGAGLASIAAPCPPEISAPSPATAMDEAQTLEALSHLGFACAPYTLATSASAAARVARENPLPLLLRAVGPNLLARHTWGGERDGVEGPAAARQAFRDILFACQAHEGNSPLSAVLVAPHPPAPEIRLFCDFRPAMPLFHLSRQGAADGFWGRLGAHETALEGQLSALLKGGRREITAVLSLLTRVAGLGPTLAGGYSLLDLQLVQLTAQGARLIHGRGLRRS